MEDCDVRQIAGQHQAKESEQVRNDVDHKPSRLKTVRIKLQFGFPVAIESGQNQQHSANRRNDAEPGGEARSRGVHSLQLQKFAQGDGETSDGESKNDGGNAGPHPRKESALVGEMVARAIGIVLQTRYYSTAF